MTLTGLDLPMALLGLAAALWCTGLSVYLVVSNERQGRASLDAITEAFGRRLAQLGDKQRAGTKAAH